MKRILIVVILASLAFGMLPGFAAAAGCTSYPLYAGQTIPVGTVTVCTNANGTLNVTYQTQDGWEISETHLHLGCSLAEIPQKNGNPPPGQFEYKSSHNPTTNTVEYTNLVQNCSPVYVAAHAVVMKGADAGGGELMVCSDGDESFMAYNNPVLGDDSGIPGGLGANPGGLHASGTATFAWEPRDNVDPSFWDSSLTLNGNPFTFSPTCDWIWESFRTVNPINGDFVDFTESFEIPGIPTGGTLWITDDNGYEASLNGNFLGRAQLSANWRTSDLKQADVDWTNWQSVEEYDLGAALEMGTNTFNISGVNEYYYPPDTENNEPGTQDLNPAGLIYEAKITYRVEMMQEETAWGAQSGPGTNPFPGKNWATYIIYNKQ